MRSWKLRSSVCAPEASDQLVQKNVLRSWYSGESRWSRAVQEAVLLRHRERGLWTGPRKGSSEQVFPWLQWQGITSEESARRAVRTESTAAALHQLGEGCCKKGQVPGCSQLLEEAPPTPQCKLKSRRSNANSHQLHIV